MAEVQIVWKLVEVFGPLVVEKVLEYLANTGTGKDGKMTQTEKKAVANILKTSPKGTSMSEDQLDRTLNALVTVARTPGLIEGSIKTVKRFWGWVSGKAGKVKEDGTLNLQECEQEVKRLRKELRDCQKACEKCEKPKPAASKPAASKPRTAASTSSNPWLAHVKEYYANRKAADPEYKYTQAMKDAKASYNR
jgi:hypothetical protein